jgi:hypothetical protein
MLSQLAGPNFQGLCFTTLRPFTSMAEDTKSLNASHKPDSQVDPTVGVSESAATAPVELTAMVPSPLKKLLFLTRRERWNNS